MSCNTMSNRERANVLKAYVKCSNTATPSAKRFTDLFLEHVVVHVAADPLKGAGVVTVAAPTAVIRGPRWTEAFVVEELLPALGSAVVKMQCGGCYFVNGCWVCSECVFIASGQTWRWSPKERSVLTETALPASTGHVQR